MNPSFDRFKKTDVENSITTTQDSNIAVNDLIKPYTLIEWVINSNLDLGSAEQHIQQYSDYLRAWATKNNKKTSTANDIIIESYKTLVQQIVLKFTSVEEKRFLSNLDFNNPLDLDIAIPFFSKKLKDIVLFLAKKRDETKFQKTKYSLFGTNDGVETLAEKLIIQLANTEDFILDYLNELPTLSDISKNLSVQTEEFYDIDDNYFDVDPCSGDNRGLGYDPHIFIDFTDAIKLLADDLGTILQSGPALDIYSEDSGTLTILSDSTNVDIQNLPYSEFENYTKSETNLNLNNQKILINQLMGNDTIYLSSGGSVKNNLGHTTVQYVTGQLATATNRLANFFNKTYPTVNYNPNKTNIHTARSLGGFFTPQHLGTSSYVSMNPHLIIDESLIENNDIYEIPDPTIYGSTKHKFIDHVDTAGWVKADKSNDQSAGDIINSNNLQKFYNYQSIVENNKFSQHGIALTQDNFDFWKGEFKDIWANDDIYPLKVNNTIDNDSRQEELLINKENLYKWRTDIFGNNFVLFKSQYANKQASLTIYPEECSYSKTLDPVYLSTCELLDGGTLIDIMIGYDYSFAYESDGSTLTSPSVSKIAFGYELTNTYCSDMISFNGEAITYECNIIDGEDLPIDFTNYTATITGSKTPGFANTEPNGADATPFDTLWDGYAFSPAPCDDLNETIKVLAEYKTLNVPMLSTTLAEAYQTSLQSYSTPITDTLSIYEHRNNSYGELWTRNINNTIIQPISSVLIDIYSKYETINPTIKNELISYIKDFDIIYDTLILQTKNYVIFEKINYNYETNKFVKSDLTNFIYTKSEDLQKGIRHFFNENNNKVYIGCTRTTDFDPATGQAVFPEIYEYDLVESNTKRIFPLSGQDLAVFGIPYDLTVQAAGTKYKTIHSPIISYNEIIDKYYITNTCVLSSKEIPDKLTGQDNIFAITQSSYEFVDNKFTYLDSLMYFPANSGSNESTDQVTSADVTLGTTTTTNIGPISSINFTLNISPESLSDTNNRYIKFIYDFNDGGDLEVVSRPARTDNLSIITTTNISDQTNPKFTPKSHTYTFTSSSAETQIAYVSAITHDYTVTKHTINIDKQPHTISSAFSAMCLIESKPFLNKDFTESNLLVLESQNPKYIVHMCLKGGKYTKTRFNY